MYRKVIQYIQRKVSIIDTLGTEKQFVIQRFPLFRGCFICTAIYLDPQKQSVIERFSLLGEFVIRGSTECMYIQHSIGTQQVSDHRGCQIMAISIDLCY